jgi:hypothetical protein
VLSCVFLFPFKTEIVNNSLLLLLLSMKYMTAVYPSTDSFLFEPPTYTQRIHHTLEENQHHTRIPLIMDKTRSSQESEREIDTSTLVPAPPRRVLDENSSLVTTERPQEFTCFPELAKELRLCIWREVINNEPPRTLIIECIWDSDDDEGKHTFSISSVDNKVSPLLFVNEEARAEAIQWQQHNLRNWGTCRRGRGGRSCRLVAYSAKGFSKFDPKKVYFDFSKDILRLAGSHYSRDWSPFHEAAKEDLVLVQNLVMGTGPGGDWSKIPDQLEEQLTPYIGLRHLTIISTQWDRPEFTKDDQKAATLAYKSRLTPVLNTIWHNICEKNGGATMDPPELFIQPFIAHEYTFP